MFTCTLVSAFAQVTHSLHIRLHQTAPSLRSVRHFHQRQYARDTEWNLYRRVQCVPKASTHMCTHTQTRKLRYKFYRDEKHRLYPVNKSKTSAKKVQRRQAQTKHKHSPRYENVTEHSTKIWQRLALSQHSTKSLPVSKYRQILFQMVSSHVIACHSSAFCF